jgi:hypothetical protein
MNKKIWKIIVATLIITGVLFIGRLFWQQRQYECAYKGVWRGADKREVIKLFGPPSHIELCKQDESWAWDGMPLPAGHAKCIEVYRYVSWVSVEEWLIGFDKNGKAITKAYLVSP